MVAPLRKDEFIRIRDILEHACGISLGLDKDYLVETRLTDLANEVEANTFSELYEKIMRDRATFLPRVIDLMTTNETSWFRDQSMWTVMEEVIIPEFYKRLSTGKSMNIKIWSAACSTGQEVYSLKFLIEETGKKQFKSHLSSKFSILGTDICNTALQLAISGKYNFLSLSRGLSTDRKELFMEQLNKHVWSVKADFRNNIRFELFNLMDDYTKFGSFDLILCRNVLIYFSQDCKINLLHKFKKSLKNDGFFMLGASESVFNYSQEFDSCEHGKGIYYRPITNHRV